VTCDRSTHEERNKNHRKEEKITKLTFEISDRGQQIAELFPDFFSALFGRKLFELSQGSG
jgi:hypothetical protein